MAAMTGKQPVFPAASAPAVKTSVAAPKPTLPSSDELARRVVEAKKRVADAQTKMANKDNPYLVRSLSLLFAFSTSL